MTLLLLEDACACEMARKQRQEQGQEVEGATAGRPKDIYRRQPPMDRSSEYGNSLSKYAA